eukprot:TRINITY_DN20530_c0_g1_i1.p2 TRINITY_DN20530_c0_g1~~TRINITY_DN20530_c0_g1_i1.p2  ORF type:complete len:147 (+),score=27.68 TRINITY_DN20530_c0_g1_i1:255-695(+)
MASASPDQYIAAVRENSMQIVHSVTSALHGIDKLRLVAGMLDQGIAAGSHHREMLRAEIEQCRAAISKIRAQPPLPPPSPSPVGSRSFRSCLLKLNSMSPSPSEQRRRLLPDIEEMESEHAFRISAIRRTGDELLKELAAGEQSPS